MTVWAQLSLTTSLARGPLHFAICCRPGNAEMAKTRMTALMTRLG
jgi:hypothetical protein